MPENAVIKLRRDVASDWTLLNPVLALGEPGLETDTNQIKYGDGTTAWTSLPYFDPGSGLTDGDKGDVVVAGGGSSLTVESATPSDGIFNVTGNIDGPEVLSLRATGTYSNIFFKNSSGVTKNSLWGSSASFYVDSDAFVVENLAGTKTFADFGATYMGLNFDGTLRLSITAAGITVAGQVTLADEVYSASWNGKLEAPTKNAVYDKISTLASATDLTNYIPLAQKGAADGVTPLDSSSKVPAIHLPSYVDDVVEYADLAAFPATGESGKIYVAIDTGKTYRWSGSAYVEISSGGIPNGDLGDVVSAGAGASLTVESATPADGTFDVTGSISTTRSSSVRGSSTGFAGVPELLLQISTGQARITAIHSGTGPIPLVIDSSGLSLRIASADRLVLGATGAAVTGNVVASNQLGAITTSAGTTGELYLGNSDASKFVDIYQNAADAFVTFSTNHLVRFDHAVEVPDEAYSSAWNGKTEVPTKNALWDKIETISGGGGLTDGDKGDVVVGGSGTTLTVESATPADGSFNVAGSVVAQSTVQITGTNPTLLLDGDGVTFYSGIQFNTGYGASSAKIWGYQGLWFDVATTLQHKFLVAGVAVATFNPNYAILSGNVVAEGSAEFKGGGHHFGPPAGATAADCDLNIRSTNYYSILSFSSASGSGGAMVQQAQIYGQGIFRFPQFSFNNSVGDVNYGTLDATGLTVKGFGHTFGTNVAPAANNVIYIRNTNKPGGFGSLNFVSTLPDGSGSGTDANIWGVSGGGLEMNGTGLVRLLVGNVSKLLMTPTDAAFSQPVTVPDDPYAAGWNGSTQVPTKNAVYDKLQTIVGLTDGDKGDVVVGGTGTTLTVESATPSDGSFDVTGKVTATGRVETLDGYWLTQLASSNSSGFGGVIASYNSVEFGGVVFSGADTSLTFMLASGGGNYKWYNNTGSGSVLQMALSAAGALTVTAGGSFGGDVTVPDEAYGAGWNGSFEVPTKNAVYDKIESLVLGGGGLTDGDKGDVVVGGSGTTLTVESATPADSTFNVTGQVVATSHVIGEQVVGIGIVARPGVGSSEGGQITLGYVGKDAIVATENGTWNVDISSFNDFRIFRVSATGDVIIPLIIAELTGEAIFGFPVSVPNETYGAGWDGDLTVPTKDAVYDKIQSMGGSVVSDLVYGPGWDGDTTNAPSKNAVYDKIETVVASIPASPSTVISDTAYAGSWDGVTASLRPRTPSMTRSKRWRLRLAQFPTRSTARGGTGRPRSARRRTPSMTRSRRSKPRSIISTLARQHRVRQ